jgi:hypothetical protein
MPMLVPRLPRRLTLDPAQHPRRQPHVSSASGLVRVGRNLYLVADDEHHLAQIDTDDPAASPVRLVRFAAGDLPADPAQRKNAKPDLEALIHFPPKQPDEANLLVALGSGSRPRRERAFVFALKADGAIAGEPSAVSLAALFQPLREHFGELNLEAGFVCDDRVHLFQRAHRGQPLNGHVTFQRDAVRAWLAGIAADPPPPLSIDSMDLGSIGGVPLGITDAAPWPQGGWIFSAVAEDTADAFNDGACVGSVVGWCDVQGLVLACERLEGNPKVEGLAVVEDGRLWMVTDADAPDRPSELLEVQWPP